MSSSINRIFIIIAVVALFAGIAMAFTFQRPPVETVQRGYRGTAMVSVFDPKLVAEKIPLNQVPAADPPVDASGQPSSTAYENVKVLKTVDSSEFLRLMGAITNWVAPEQGCTYCHSQENLALDTLYTKVVARRMIQMTQHINTFWKSHVGTTGVTCYTCHRGQPVPANIWFAEVDTSQRGGMAQGYLAKNRPSDIVGQASLPHDIFTPFLDQSYNIRVAATTALPTTDQSTIKQTEWTYGLMAHISQALGVNCTYCHNTRSFSDWSQSTPQRATAWYGIRMVRDLNTAYLDPLTSVFPPNRLGPAGDGPKINCTTCHQGVFKPLYGASMVKDYPELGMLTEAAATQ